MAQPVETATDHRRNTQIPWTDNGKCVKAQTVQAGEYRQTNKWTDRQTDATKCIISPASRSIIKYEN